MPGGIPIVLVGCKKDLEKQRAIDYEDAERIADAFKCPYIEVSSKDDPTIDNNVDNVFELLLVQLFKKEKVLSKDMNEVKNKALQRTQTTDDSCCTLF